MHSMFGRNAYSVAMIQNLSFTLFPFSAFATQPFPTPVTSLNHRKLRYVRSSAFYRQPVYWHTALQVSKMHLLMYIFSIKTVDNADYQQWATAVLPYCLLPKRTSVLPAVPPQALDNTNWRAGGPGGLEGRDDHYPVCRLDIRQDSEFATGYGYPKTAFEPEPDPDIRYAFLDISMIQTF